MAEARRQRRGQDPAAGAEIVRFTEALCAATTIPDLARNFTRGFRSMFDIPSYGLYVFDQWTGRADLVASANVSDTFLARYEHEGREVDPLNAHVLSTAHAAYNVGLMPMEAWLESSFYRRVARLHDVRHLIQTPIVARAEIVGSLNFGTSDPDRGFTPHEVRLAEALGRVLGTAIERIRSGELIERERDHAQAALELTGAAVVISDSAAIEPRLNDAARRLLAEVGEGEELLHRLIARPGNTGAFTHHVEVELVSGGTGLICGHSSLVRPNGGAVITVLELQRDRAEISEQALVALTPREREVVLLVVDGLTDRQIAERLFLSRHTVSQYVKCVYRKLEVDSRVSLTRLLLSLPGGPAGGEWASAPSLMGACRAAPRGPGRSSSAGSSIAR